MSDPDKSAKGDFQRDVELDKPGIVGARWWNRSLQDEDKKVSRRKVVVGLMVGGGALAAIAAGGVGLAKLMAPEPTSLVTRNALQMQKQYGWDFGARGVPLVFDGKVEGPFVRTQLSALSYVMAPSPQGPNAKYQVSTLLESLLAAPAATLPDPEDGRPAPDSAPFKRLADVIMPIVTPAMQRAYAAGEALGRLGGWKKGLAVLVDLPGPEAVAFAAGAAATFEPVLLLDNWPHPHGVVPSHLTLAALAYYQPRFASQKERVFAAPLFVLDRSRLNPYTEASDRFDNRYLARMPKLQALAKDGVRALLYVVSSPRALPEPADLTAILSAGGTPPGTQEAPAVEVRAVALTDFAADPAGPPDKLLYGGSATTDARFSADYAFGGTPVTREQQTSSTTKDYRFIGRSTPAPARPVNLGMVPVIATASGFILAGALIDRQGSMNRFAGGWYG
jgi:hypothetical protein